MRVNRPQMKSMRLHNLFSICAALAVALVASTSLYAQTGDEFDFDDIPVDDARQYYVAVGGGYLGMLAFPNFEELNKVGAGLGLPAIEGQLYMNGGGGLISLLVVPNLRLGVFGAAGSRVSEAEVTGQDGAAYRRSLRFTTVATAGQLDYAIRLFRSFTILPGIMVGSGRYTLELSQSKVAGEQFPEVFQTGDPTVGNRYARISRSHLFYYPALNLEYAFTQFVMVRAGAGYSGTSLEGAWTDAAEITVNNVPDISASGFTLQFGLFVGLFQTQ